MTQLFLASAANIVMDDIVKHLPKKPTEYKVSFIPTAAEVEEGDLWWLRDDRNKLVEAGFQLTEFSITGLNKYQIEDKLKDIDLIFISGGNIFYLLDQCIKSEFDQVLREKINNGVIYIGASAGSALVGRAGSVRPWHGRSPACGGLHLCRSPHALVQRVASDCAKALVRMGLGRAGLCALHDALPRRALLRNPGQCPQPAAAPGC